MTRLRLWTNSLRTGSFLVLTLLLPVFPTACTKVGPDYVRPNISVAPDWTDAADTRLSNQSPDYREWWRIFNDPVLDRVVDTAYRQNLSLAMAGMRVIEARAQLAIAVGRMFPQVQEAFGSLEYSRLSQHSALSSFAGNSKYAQDEVGLRASWELDFWGRFRRNIESADAGVNATLADYDSMLVSLTAEAARAYTLIRTLESRLQIAAENVSSQEESLRIADVRFRNGTTSARDVEQARTQLHSTLSTIPAFRSQLQQARNALNILLGLPPGDMIDLGSTSVIPIPPPQIAAGIPSDLIRRRPDVRSAEYRAIAQGAQIGVAKADLFPAFSLGGTFSFLSTNVGGSKLSDMLRWKSRSYTIGPSASWNLFNYGRIMNNVRLQDALFQELLMNYQYVVLTAQREVEDSLSGYLRGQERVQLLFRSAEAARASLALALAQYRGGAADFTTVLTGQQALLNQQDSLAVALGDVATSLIAVYRALGGGWEIREGMELVSEEVKRIMEKRTNWGDLLKASHGSTNSTE